MALVLQGPDPFGHHSVDPRQQAIGEDILREPFEGRFRNIFQEGIDMVVAAPRGF